MVLKRLLGMKKAARTARGPAHSRAYAIGDIHGRLDLLEALLERIEDDHRRRGPCEKVYLVTLGDLVDRGPDSCGVIERLANRPPSWARAINLQGNHEEFFTRVLDGEEELVPSWLTYGGYECCESYGLSRGWTLNHSAGEIADRLARAVPASHREFLAHMADSFRFGDYLFVHAGIRPGIPIAEQSARDLRWIREGFLDDFSDHGVTVVHGHTIVEEVEEHSNRIAIDTGAYRSGVLTAIGLEGSERWFVSATAQAPVAAEA